MIQLGDYRVPATGLNDKTKKLTSLHFPWGRQMLIGRLDELPRGNRDDTYVPAQRLTMPQK